jgi:hypothetical protein
MSSYDTWHNLLSGISQGSFDKIYLRDASGNMVDLLTMIGALGGGITDVISQSSELVVTTNGTTKILTLNLSGYLSSSHEASHVGAANVAFGAFDINTRTVTLQNSSGVTVGLSVDLGGNLTLNGSDGVLTVPILNAWVFFGCETDRQRRYGTVADSEFDRRPSMEWESIGDHKRPEQLHYNCWTYNTTCRQGEHGTSVDKCPFRSCVH